ncbi:PaaI family thioesterase [Aestuariimicrobium sp. p3-SID1156]|uniref:PaaI family thioesterase n=1 Tax=Aestuariimicrobium sp. p3-SID1156 TaxID=2916038 RepID=UPI00223AAB7D|nr:PaaI family thioesterase [Aestuariimicrobium sp. p3-SID1156]MCT1458951.1 PaaI family thioesterase [Aestuariimicrobium sp. p3-SID1156]
MIAPFRSHNGIDWVDGTVVCTTDDRHANVGGTVHGGVIATMLDAVMGGSVIQALPEDRTAVTSSLTVNYLDPAFIGDTLVATASIRRIGRTLAYVDGTLTRRDQDVPLATASGVFAVIARPGA